MSRREVLMQALAATPGDLERMARGWAGVSVANRPAADQWSIADVLCHLTMVEEQHLPRLQLVVAKQRPEAASGSPLIPLIHPNAAAHDLTQPVVTMLSNFRQARQTTLAFLQALKAGDWQRTAVHPTRGSMTFRALVQHMVDHDTAHLNQIIEIRDRRLEIVSTSISNR